MYTIAFYAPILPQALIYSLIGLLANYWLDKFRILRRRTIKCALNKDLSVNIFFFSILLMINNNWLLSHLFLKYYNFFYLIIFLFSKKNFLKALMLKNIGFREKTIFI